MTCNRCGEGVRVPTTRPYVDDRDGHIAVVTGVPVTAWESCGETWLNEDDAIALDAMLTDILKTHVVGVRPFAT